MIVARVFPSKTRATPNDDLAFYDVPPMNIDNIDEVHVSVTFKWDIRRAEWLAKQWEGVAPVKIGGPAIGTIGGEFAPGMYLKPGYVITSRGCPNKCGHCDAWKRDGITRELPITQGWNVLDDNILACSEMHIRNVFKMLKVQSERVLFTGGLEAARLKDWHIDLLADLRASRMYFAYDRAIAYEPLVDAAARMKEAGFTRNHLYAYVLIGYKNDTLEKARARLESVKKLGVTPFAMLYIEKDETHSKEWERLRHKWVHPARIWGKEKVESNPLFKEGN